MLKTLSAIFAAVFLFACSEEIEQKPTTPLVINTSNGEIRFNVELAQTPKELQTGLMYRTQMPLNNGMIFSIYPVRPTGMWMKNTKISLDMLFIAPDATISMIKENATPMSEDIILSRDPVRAVIELNAGQVKRYGIKVGDKINHAIFNNLTTLSDTPLPQQPGASAAGPIIPKGPNAPAAGPVIPKGPNASAAGPIIPKGPNAPAAGPVIPKGPNAPAAGPVIPKGPNAPVADQTSTTQPSGPIKLPVPNP